MRKHLSATRLLMAAVTAMAAAGIASAADPMEKTTTVTKTVTKPETEKDHLANLREIRRVLSENRNMLKEDKFSEKDADYKASMEAMRAAIDAVNKEVVTFEHAHPELEPEKPMMKK